MKSNKELLWALRNSDIENKTGVYMCSDQPNDDYIDFENDKSISIYDIDLYRNEYKSMDTDLSFEEYLVEQTTLYVEGMRDLPV